MSQPREPYTNPIESLPIDIPRITVVRDDPDNDGTEIEVVPGRTGRIKSR